ncbi:MAG TPA: cobalamin B12-binding domain-containing protein [Chloroflexota bacterium]
MRVLVGKVGLDGHDRGVKVVCRALRDAGMEVIYTGLHRTPEDVVEAAIQEDVDLIGISVLSGAHMHIFPRVIELLRERQAADILVFGGGVISPNDAGQLEAAGVAAIFGQDSSLQAIVDWVRDHVS